MSNERNAKHIEYVMQGVVTESHHKALEAGAAALREIDTLRAQLAAANERAEKAEAERADALRCSGENAKAWQEAVCDEAVKRTHLLKEIGLTEQQRDALAARVAELEGQLKC